MRKKTLNQIVAVERDVKSAGYKDITKEHHLIQKPALTNGGYSIYRPKDAEGEPLPPKTVVVQASVPEELKLVERRMTELFDLTFTKDVGNQSATADLVVDDTVLVKDVPVATLLFLEKQLQDLHTFVTKLPVLDPAETWKFDATTGHYVTQPVETIRTGKVARPIVLYPATAEHPAQTQLIQEDVVQGTWVTVKQSGAIPEPARRAIAWRIEAIQKAAKEARERANSIEVDDHKMASKIFDFILKG